MADPERSQAWFRRVQRRHDEGNLTFKERLSSLLARVRDSSTEYSLAAALGLLYHFTADPASSRVFVRPFVGGLLFGGEGEADASDDAGEE
jgi:hypothetical protein